MFGLLTLSFAQLRLGFALDVPSPSWRTKTAVPTARGQAAVITGDDGLIYVMGGFDGVAPFSTVEAYNPSTDTWDAKMAMPEATRGAAVAKGLDGIIYVIGGFNGTGKSTTVQTYNISSNSWSIKTSIPVDVWMAGAATGNDGKIYVFGGESYSVHYSNKTQIYDPLTDSWTNGTDMPTARSLLGVAKGPDGLIYAIGGYNGSVLSVVEAYNPLTDTWTEKAPMPSPKVEFGLILGPDEKLYVIGGGISYGNNIGPFFNTVEIYDSEIDTWIIPGWAESAMPTPRKELSAALGNNGRLYAIGGANGVYVSANEEASITLPANIPPTAYIVSISPNPTTCGQTVSFVGNGADPDGSITAYKWRSSIDGNISTAATFNLSTLTNGTHTVYFSVKDDDGAWSIETMAVITVSINYTEDPNYQQITKLNQTVNDLKQQNTQLNNKVDNLNTQIENLNTTVDDLNKKLNVMTLEVLGTGIITIILVIVAIVVVYMAKSKKNPPTTYTAA